MNEAVLLIDDEHAFRVLLETALRAEGYDVRTAPTCATGLAEWRRDPSDIVIVDRNLPDGDGIDLVSTLKQESEERNADCALLVVTAYADIENAVDALRRGADDYVSKPVQLSDLIVKLRKVRESRRLQHRVLALRHREASIVATLRQSRSAAMIGVLAMADRVAESTSTAVLLQGESGSGKDMLARYLHAQTPGRSEAAFIELNCAAISEQLAESELFGHERGAFTDAKGAKRGLLELAHEGTLFLDEIGDLGLGIQAKLLRVLESMRFRRVGGTRDVRVDIRIISASNRDLASAVEAGAFRLDLYHRLNVFHLHVPPLRERRDDIVPLALGFLREAALRLGKKLGELTPAAVQALESYSFPGNVRELKNLVERAVILETGTKLSERSLGFDDPRLVSQRPVPKPFFSVGLGQDGKPPTLRDVERAYVERVIEHTAGNKSQAARLLDVSFPTISRKITGGDGGSEG